jgi:hypothetical protein
MKQLCRPVTQSFRYVRQWSLLPPALPAHKTGRDPDGAVVAPPALGGTRPRAGRRGGGRPDGHRRRHDVPSRALAVRPRSGGQSRVVDRRLSRWPLRRWTAGPCPPRRAGVVRCPRSRAEVDIAASLRVRREILLTLVLVNGCLALAFALGKYFVLKRISAHRLFSGGAHHATAGRNTNLAVWIVIGALLVNVLFNLFQTSFSNPRRGPGGSDPAYPPVSSQVSPHQR